MRLVATSIGATRTLQINGQSVTTAYLKEPVLHPVRVTTKGVEGNEVAVHTDAIYAIADEHYEYWAARLGQTRDRWPYGFFAENFTIQGLKEDELRVGDLLQIGSDVQLLVAGPRIPCFKLAWRLKQPESFIAEFALSGRTGVYFAVAREGRVQAGDDVRMIRTTNLPTVRQVATMIFTEAVDIDTLRMLLSTPNLSLTVAFGLRNRLYRTLDITLTKAHRWDGWRPLRIDKVVTESSTIRSFYLRPLDDRPLPSFRAGQFLTVRVPIEPGRTVQRTWSISEYAAHMSTYRLSIKREDAGLASRWMHEHAGSGTVFEVSAPNGRFVLDRGGFKPVILIAAGVGITPLLAMAQAHVARGPDAPLLYLVYCTRNSADRAFRAEIDALARTPTIRVSYVSTAPGPGEIPGVDHHCSGRLTFENLMHLLADLDEPWYNCDIYMCGPSRFQSELIDRMATQGMDVTRVKTEAFSVVSGQRAVGVSVARIRLDQSERELTWSVDSDKTLLELLEDNGVAVASNCRMGLCGTCRCGLIEGKVSYDPQPPYLPSESVLLCCARPDSCVVRLNL